MKKLISLALVIVMTFGLLAMPALAANPWTKASDWAVPEMERANGQGLIPDSLKNKDLTSNVTRAEFAAVAVKVYENLTGTKATAPAKNPFTDTSDAEVLKAYNTGLMVGVSESKFDPGAILNREQMATALTRVLKRAYIPGWTMQADGDYTLNFAQPSKFADDAATSDWAKPSVYFMFAKEIISGTGGNQFSPKQNATREQSVAIGLRIVEKLKGKPLDYAKSGTDNPPKRELSAAERELVGVWAHGSVDLGFWTQYDQGAYSIEEYRPSSGAGGIVYTFNDDGTYSMYSWVNSVYVGQTSSLETGNWAVIKANTIQFSNKFVVYYEDFKNPGNSYKNREWEERWGGYILYYVRSDSIEYGYEGFFFHDSDLDFIQQRAADGNYSMDYYRKRD